MSLNKVARRWASPGGWVGGDSSGEDAGDEWAELVIGNAWDTPLVDAKWEPGAGRQVLSRHGFPRYAQFAIPRLLDLIAQGLKQWINFDWSGRINCDAEVTNQQYKKTKLPQIAAFIL